MNIYELEKLATPGPWFGTQSSVLGRTAPEVTRETHICSTDENWLPHSEQDANGALIRHCRNNFMKALEALKYMVRFAECNGMLNCHDEPQEYCEVCRARKVIAELEEVK